MDRLDVLGVVGVDQDADGGKDIAGADLLSGQGVPAPPQATMTT